MDNVSVGSLLTRTQRLILGFFVLLLVDIIWVSSTELSKYMNHNETSEKPFFATYIRSCMFSIYLLGFCFWPPWRGYCNKPTNYVIIDTNIEDDNYVQENHSRLSNPIYVPVKTADRENIEKSSGTESDDSSIRSVRFNKLAEVRQMSDSEAAEALMARLSYQASLRAGELAKKAANRLPIYKVIKIAFVSGLLWFIANYTYVLALRKMQVERVNLLSSTSSLFTLILSGLFPSNQMDKFALSKLLAVLLSILGLGLVSFSKINIESPFVPEGALLAFLHAFFSASYIVFLKRKVDHEDKIDIPLFFGFMGLINMFILWPILLFLNFNDCERIEWPTRHQWVYLLLNGLIGTVIAEVIWLWGCFLTSSLLAMIVLSLVFPLTMLTDVLFKKVTYPYLFYAGSFPMVLAVVTITLLSYYENWDPVLNVLHCAYRNILNKITVVRCRVSEYNSEQTEALIGINCENEA